MVATRTPVQTPDLRPSRVTRTAIEERLMQCYDAAAADPSDPLVSLHRAADDYGRNARMQGLYPEQMVIALKRLLCCHGDFATLPSLREEQLDVVASFGNTKYARVLRWCIESYYDDRERPH